MCTKRDWCWPSGGKCIVSPACRDTEYCLEEGRCTFRDGECIATSKEDCRQSKECWDGDHCYLNREEKKCDDESGTRFNSPGLMAGGVAAIIVGGLGAVVGGLMLSDATNPERGLDEATRDTETARGVAVLVVGLSVLSAGIPMLVVGRKRVPKKTGTALAPTFTIGPTGGSLSWSF